MLYFLRVTWPGGLCDEGPSELLRGDIALAAGFIAYAGPFTAAFRGAPGAPADPGSFGRPRGRPRQTAWPRLIAHWLEKAKEASQRTCDLSARPPC